MGSHILPNKGLHLLRWTNELMNDGHLILQSLCNNAAEERQQKAALLPAKPTGITLSHPPSWLFAPHLSLFCTFAASIFEESPIFHGHASGRFPSTWDGSIISSSFAWLKPDKHNALCSTGNAVCIILVFEYISEYLPMDWSQFLAMSTHQKSFQDEYECLLWGKLLELMIWYRNSFGSWPHGNVLLITHRATADDENETDQYTEPCGQLVS